jgi:hypothetical protein
MDPDPDPDADSDPSIFITDLQDANKKLIFLKIFPAYYFFKVPVLLHHQRKILINSLRLSIATNGLRNLSILLVRRILNSLPVGRKMEQAR